MISASVHIWIQVRAYVSIPIRGNLDIPACLWQLLQHLQDYISDNILVFLSAEDRTRAPDPEVWVIVH